MVNFKCCPIEIAIEHIGKKWAINIIRDLFEGRKRFNEFLKANKNLSTKMLSARLKELEKDEIIEKKVVQMSPVIIEYRLTKKGLGLNRILYELGRFSIIEYGKEVFDKEPKAKEVYLGMINDIFLKKSMMKDKE